MIKARCPECGENSFIDDGKTCCGIDVDISGALVSYKRESGSEKRKKSLKYMTKLNILEQQDYRCAYCKNEIGISVGSTSGDKLTYAHYDHFMPWAIYQDSNHDNILASCNICNSIKSSRYFGTIEEARKYIMTVRKNKGYDKY
jgi:5-methylcytosine-specific restriction endonuclease McrA